MKSIAGMCVGGGGWVGGGGLGRGGGVGGDHPPVPGRGGAGGWVVPTPPKMKSRTSWRAIGFGGSGFRVLGSGCRNFSLVWGFGSYGVCDAWEQGIGDGPSHVVFFTSTLLSILCNPDPLTLNPEP